MDGAAPSRLALDWAVTEARLRNGQVRAVTAWEFPPATVGTEGLVWDAEVFPRTARQLQNEALKRVDSEGVTVTGEVVQGNAAAVLLGAAGNADLLVVGSRGLGGFTGLLLGSVATQVLRHAPCPLLVVSNRSRTAGEE
ncbi:universal stress protein [Arthrobacter sp. AL12]|uniref:universal stress protein n=1 Tax=Arthrobacter sp. AL12 TaxID=3042241 RepID=UPI00249B744C|nr:universal stress protein [Arthrobacter sp. AL12]MDI3213958.1 universal stress protein [Arthrobacter sp. AL12]